MMRGALDAIRELLDDGDIPRGTFADDHVRNLVALYNQRGGEIERLRAALDELTAPDCGHPDCTPCTRRGWNKTTIEDLFPGLVEFADPDALTGCADDQKWTGVGADELRERAQALAEARENE